MSPILRLLFCILIPACLTQKVIIAQDPPLLRGKVGSEAVLKCEQRTTDHDYMYWYYHSRGQGLRLVASMLRNNEPTYEDGYKNGGYGMNRTHADKHSSLTIAALTDKHQGVYFCASSDGVVGASAAKLEFGGGTVLSVLEKDDKIIPPKVTIYRPSKQEIEVHRFISLVCVASDFFPEHVKITWLVNGVERINLYEPVPEKKTTDKKPDKVSYSTSKRLTLTKEEYFNPESTFKCVAAFLDGEGTDTAEVKGEADCSISKETYTIHVNQGKISYIMILCKSGLYALVVLALLWRKKVIANSY